MVSYVFFALIKDHTADINPMILPTIVSIVTIFNPEDGLGVPPGKSRTSFVVVNSFIILNFGYKINPLFKKPKKIWPNSLTIFPLPL
jgi:hypothetical protein